MALIKNCLQAFSFLFLFSISAFAFEGDPSSATDRPTDFGKQSFLPARSDSYFESAPGIISIKGKTLDTGVKTSDFKSDLSAIAYLVGYGITEELSINLSGDYTFSSLTTYEYGPGSELSGTSDSYKSLGPSDPKLSIVARVKNNEATKVKADIEVGYTPKSMKSFYATETDSGNRANGGTRTDLAIRFFKEVGDFEIKLGIQKSMLSDYIADSATTLGMTSEATAHDLMLYQLGGMLRTSETSFFGANFDFQMTDSYKSKQKNNGTTTSTLAMDSWGASGMSFVAKFLTSQRSALTLVYNYLLPSTRVARSGATRIDFNYDSGTSLSLGWSGTF